MPAQLDRALLLLQQNRFELAERELRQHLSNDTDDPFAHALLSQCLVHQKQYPQAIAEAETAIRLEPLTAYSHFVLADAYFQIDRYREALAAIREALQIDPSAPSHHSLHAAILLAQRQPEQALQSVKQGLELDPEHTGCVNLHAIILRQIGRTRETEQFAEDALKREPENAVMHAAQGWNRLEHGQTRQALDHFREALRLDPDLEYARHGMVETIKSRFAPYRWLVKYSLWTSRLSRGQTVMFILGLWFAIRFLREVARGDGTLAAIALPVVLIYIAFVYLTWTAYPLSNVLLRLHPFGRLALSKDERLASTLAGSCLGLAIASVGLAPLAGVAVAAVSVIVFALAVIPIAAAFTLEGKRRVGMQLYCAATVTIGLFAIAQQWGLLGDAEGNTPLGPYLLAVYACTWIAVGLQIAG